MRSRFESESHFGEEHGGQAEEVAGGWWGGMRRCHYAGITRFHRIWETRVPWPDIVWYLAKNLPLMTIPDWSIQHAHARPKPWIHPNLTWQSGSALTFSASKMKRFWRRRMSNRRCVLLCQRQGWAMDLNVNPGLINHGLLIRGYPPNSHNMVHKWYPPN